MPVYPPASIKWNRKPLRLSLFPRQWFENVLAGLVAVKECCMRLCRAPAAIAIEGNHRSALVNRQTAFAVVQIAFVALLGMTGT